MPMRTARASSISWITKPYDPTSDGSAVSGVAKNASSFPASAASPPCRAASPAPSCGAVNAVPHAFVSV